MTIEEDPITNKKFDFHHQYPTDIFINSYLFDSTNQKHDKSDAKTDLPNQRLTIHKIQHILRDLKLLHSNLFTKAATTS